MPFYEYFFGVKYPTYIDIPLNKESSIFKKIEYTFKKLYIT